MALAAWVALIFVFSSQTYQKQTIQPTLNRSLTFQKAEEVLPKVEFNYNHTTYSSRVNPYSVIEFMFRKAAHLFVYAMLAIDGHVGWPPKNACSNAAFLAASGHADCRAR